VKRLSDCRITIVGLGLMGGSLAGALRGQCRELTGVERQPAVLAVALSRQLIDRGTTDLGAGLARADVVVLATPVRTILKLLGEIGPLLPAGCLLLDLGSTKAQVVARMEALPDHVQPLGGHPMCGKEVSGIEAADPDLYQGQTWMLCPLLRTTPAALALGCALVTAVGARPLVLDAARQDDLSGTVSHLPYLLACALIDTAHAVAAADPAVGEVAAGGFCDTSRVAASDVTMWLDILLTNREVVVQAVRTYQAHLDQLVGLVAGGDEVALRAALGAVREKRLEMFP